MAEFTTFRACDLDLDLGSGHTAYHHASLVDLIPNVIEIEDFFCGQTDVRTFETHFIKSTRRSRPN